MNNKQLKWGSVLSYLQMGLSIIIGILYTPFMIRTLGQSEYGLYNTVSSTISMLSILSLGFNSSYVRYYSKYKSKEDYKSIYRLNGLFFIVFLCIGFVALICGLFLSVHLEFVFSSGLTTEEYTTARILMLLLTINLSLSFPMSVFSSIISANERFIVLKMIGMVSTVGGPLVTMPLLIAGYRSIAMVGVSVSLSFISYGLYFFYVIVVLKQKFVFRNFEKGLFRSLFTYTFFIAVNLIIDQINWNIDKILLGRFKGTSAVAVYSVGYSLYGYYSMFSTSISSVFTPRIHLLVNSTKDNKAEQKKQLTYIFTKVGRIQFAVLGLVASGVVFFGHSFITKIWAGEEYGDSYIVALLLILSASIALIQNLGIEIQRAQNLHKFRSEAYSIMALINLCLSIYLCQIYGAIGSAVGTTVSLIIANGIVMNIYYQKRCNIDIGFFWREILKIAKGLIIPIFVGVLFLKLERVWSLKCFLLQIIGYTFIYSVSMYLFGLNDYEKELLLAPAKKAKIFQ